MHLNEIDQHSIDYLKTMESEFLFVKRAVLDIDWTASNMLTHFNRFYFVTEGEALVEIDNHSFTIPKNHLFLLPSNRSISYKKSSDKTILKKYFCHFHAKVGSNHLFDLLKTDYGIEVKDPIYLTNCFEKLIAYYKSTSLTSSIMASSIFNEILCYYLDNINIKSINLPDMTYIDQINSIIKYIKNHLDKSHSIEELAKMVNLHPNYFIKIFKQTCNTTPIHFINGLKIEKACDLLISTNHTIAEIATLSGFKNPYYFSEYFKKKIKVSPKKYRQHYHQILKRKDNAAIWVGNQIP